MENKANITSISIEKNKIGIKLSIIVPVYNIIQYLPKCLDSILSQTLRDIEIICVDDCSTDSSFSILEEYKSKDDRIKLLKLAKNYGQGYARNRGIEIAQGEYIGFVDGDDYIDPNYFEALYNSAVKNNADISVASILKHKKNYKKYNVIYKKEGIAENIQDKIKLCGDKKKFFFYAWNKIYKTDLIKNNGIEFAQGQIYEDVIFAIEALYYSNRVVSVPNIKYHYIERKNSSVKRKDITGKKEYDLTKAYTELQDFCHEHNIILPERLNYFTSVWYNPFIKTYIGKYYAKKFLLGLVPIKKKRINFSYPIDLVYLWVDGNDYKWKEKKEYWQQRTAYNNEVFSEYRFINNEELKFSLRSVEKYCSWINKIYIITDNQAPEWLKTCNDKINIIFHKDLISDKNLPLFNSEAIETYLPYIPNLSECFLYANDDMFFGKYVTKNFFYDENQQPIIRLKQQVSRRHCKNNMYTRKILEMQKIIRKAFHKSYEYAPHHNIDAYKKSDFIECLEYFKEKVDMTRTHKFRTENDFQRSIIGYYTLAKRNGRMKLYSRVDRWLDTYSRIKRFLNHKYCADSIMIDCVGEDYHKRLNKYNPYLFCMNDIEKTTNADRVAMKKFLQELFPNKSEFERDEEVCQQ